MVYLTSTFIIFIYEKMLKLVYVLCIFLIIFLLPLNQATVFKLGITVVC